MDDQVQQLKRRNIRAEAIHHGLSAHDIDRILDNCIYGDVKILYLSPERLRNELFLTRISKTLVSFIAIDEAHCISQWGHDFRPAYLSIIDFLKLYKHTPVMALTATATPRVVNEILKHIDRDHVELVRGSFLRDNIYLSVRNTEDKLNVLKQYITNRSGKTIVYIRSRRQVEMICNMLNSLGVSVAFFHAGISYEQKIEAQKKFTCGEIDVIVATNAFGMGIDIPDVRHVCHFGLPGSIEEYYQEVGRAGRDGANADALTIYSKYDREQLDQSSFYNQVPWTDVVRYYKYLFVHYHINIGEGENFHSALYYDKLAVKWGKSVKEVYHLIDAFQQLEIVQVDVEDSNRILICATLDLRELREVELVGDIQDVLDYCIRRLNGFFDGWAEFDLDKAKKFTGINKKQLGILLIQLQKKGYIKYFLDKSGDKINFLKNRVHSSDVDMYRDKYETIGQMYRYRREMLTSFLDAKQCYTQLILNYFGEYEAMRCNNCAYCDRHNIAAVSSPYDYQAAYDRAWRNSDLLTMKALQELYNEGLIQLSVRGSEY